MSTKDFADTLVDDLIEMVCMFQNRTASVGDVERQAEMVKQALRVPSPPSEDILSVRDQFAMAALQGLLAGEMEIALTQAQYAESAYRMADQMMKAREVKA